MKVGLPHAVFAGCTVCVLFLLVMLKCLRPELGQEVVSQLSSCLCAAWAPNNYVLGVGRVNQDVDMVPVYVRTTMKPKIVCVVCHVFPRFA